MCRCPRGGIRCIVNSGDGFLERTLGLVVGFLIDFRHCGERVCLPQARFRTLVFGRFLSDFALAARLFKSFRRCRGIYFAGSQVWFRTLVFG